MGEVDVVVLDGQLDKGRAGEIMLTIVAIDLGNKVKIKHFTYQQQAFYIDTFTLEQVIE